LDATEKAEARAGVTGAERAMVYRLALSTGLRVNEIRTLRRSSFNLNSDHPAVTVAAAYAKNRRETVQPLPAELVPLLKDHLSDKLPSAAAFDMLKPNMVARVLKADLSAARQAWLTESTTAEARAERQKTTFLCYRNEARQVADFHAFRHTFITNLVNGGVHPKMAQALARHQSIALTMERYSHVHRGELSKALSVLPPLVVPIPAVKAATGTVGGVKKTRVTPPQNLSLPLSPESEVCKGSVGRDGVLSAASCPASTNEKTLQTRGLQGSNGETGIRTPDTGLTPYNGLANRRLQPLGHLSGEENQVTHGSGKRKAAGGPPPL
jgi:hypothetical protein